MAAPSFIPRSQSPTPVSQENSFAKVQTPTSSAKILDYPERMAPNIPNRNTSNIIALKDRVTHLENEGKVKDLAIEALKIEKKSAIKELEDFKKEKLTLANIYKTRNDDLEARFVELQKKIEGTHNEALLKQSILTLETEHKTETELITELESQNRELDNENQRLKEKLQLEIQVSSELRQTVQDTTKQLESYIPDLSLVIRPTANDLENLLLSLNPLITKISALSKKINITRDAAEKIEELIKKDYANATAIILNEALKVLDPAYNNLCAEYLSLYPLGQEALKSLSESIKSATHAPIPEEYVKSMSAMNYLPQDTIENNKKIFTELLAKTKAAKAKLSTELVHMNRRYDDAARHLNYIDGNYGYLTKPKSLASSLTSSINIVSWADKVRISPTAPAFVLETESTGVKS
jgi:DNA repair exonuclease SbcCD ATPase subunit